MKKNHVIILVSVILSVVSAATATILIIRHFRKKALIAPSNLAFEMDFTEEQPEEAVAE